MVSVEWKPGHSLTGEILDDYVNEWSKLGDKVGIEANVPTVNGSWRHVGVERGARMLYCPWCRRVRGLEEL